MFRIRNIMMRSNKRTRGNLKMSKIESISQIINLNRNFNRTLRHEFHDLMQNSGFTLPQLSVISILAKNGEQKVSDISEKMGLSDSTVSGILDRLEQKGIIERKRDKDDRRVVKIYLIKGSQPICREFHRKRENILLVYSKCFLNRK